ncbi:MAG: nucleotide exchange factor GrpE [Chloroflexi bacterium]|nr:nucleotide exchange factor GrpE [Chloroflexota bacterium]
MAEEPQNTEHENGAHQDAASDAASQEAVIIDIESAVFAELPWEEQVGTLREILQESRTQTAQNLDLAQRAQAEMANQRRRSDEERISQGKYSNGRLIAKLLPVVEELALAMGLVEDNNGVETSGDDAQDAESSPESSWIQGVRLIQRKFMTLLESEGVTTIDAVGTVFNPLEHEALGTDESTEYPPGHVIKAVRQGYRLHDRIIQPAQVIVAREPQDVGKGDTSSEVKETDNG